MEERREQLDLVAADAELELPAAVRADPVVGAVVVGGEEPLDGAEPRGLHVDRPRRPAEGLDVGDRVDHCVPGDPVVVRLEHGLGLRRERRILEPRVGKPVDDPAVERGVGHGVDARAAVLALEVDRVDRPRGGELRDQLLRPVGRRVELEAQPGIEAEPGVAGDRSSAGSPRRIETTKVSGSGVRPTAAASDRPAWRSARSSAALSKAQRR